MVRSLIFRLPGIRAFLPRVTRPLLPLSARISAGPPSARLFRHFPARLTSSSPTPGDHPEPHALPPNASLSQRLKHLIRSYGWYALGVYIVLSTLDFTVAFVGINILGAEYVSQVTTAAKEYLHNLTHSRPQEPGREEMDSISGPSSQTGREELYAMLVLAYTVHKTLFLPLRIGLTAAFTPRLVGWLRSRGWAGGAGTMRAAKEMRERMRSGRDHD